MKASKAWIIKPTVSRVKREVQCLLKIGILAKDKIFMSELDVNVISASPVKQPIIENAVYEREEAIAITGFSLSTLIRAEKSGGLKGRHKGRRRYYLGSDLLRWLQEEHYGLSKVERRQKSR